MGIKDDNHRYQKSNNFHNNGHHQSYNNNNYRQQSNASSSSSMQYKPKYSNNTSTSGPTPMDTAAAINNNNYTRQPINDVVHSYRITNNLCLYCGGANHQVKDCRSKDKGKNVASSLVSTILEQQDHHHQLNSITMDGPIDYNPADPYTTNNHNLLLVQHLNTRARKETKDLTSVLLEGNMTPFIVQSIDCNLMVIPVELISNHRIIQTYALVDSGASASFISVDLVKSCQLITSKISTPMVYKLANGTLYTNDSTTSVGLQIAGTHHQEIMVFRQLPNAAFPIILGNNWLSRHDPEIHWRQVLLALACLHQKANNMRHCYPVHDNVQMRTTCYPPVVREFTPPVEIPQVNPRVTTSVAVVTSQGNKRRIQDSPESLAPSNLKRSRQYSPSYSEVHLDDDNHSSSSENDSDTDSMASHEWRRHFPELGPGIDSEFWDSDRSCSSYSDDYFSPEDHYFENRYDENQQDDNDDIISIYSSPDLNSPVISPIASPMNIDKMQINMSYHSGDNNYLIRCNNSNKNNVAIHNHHIKDQQQNHIIFVASITTSESEELAEFNKIPPKYQEFSKVFSKRLADKLPPHRVYDHKIILKPDTTVPFGPLYNLSETELNTLKEYLEENLEKGFIERSESPAGAPVLFVKKKDGSLRLCVDYRGPNRITVPNRCPLSLISETLDRLYGCSIFTKMDMRGAYNLLRIAKGDEWKTAFRTRYGHFQYNVMPFGLCNAPASFQAFVNDTLREYLDSFLVVYLDDLLIFSKNEEEHTQHVKLVLKKILDANLSLKLKKCEFDVTSVQFLGFTIGKSTLTMDTDKIEAIKNWTTPKSVHDIQVFLGLSNFYRRFIKDYSKRCIALTSLLKKDVPFIWSKQANDAFNEIKDAITRSPILRHYNPKIALRY